ncbi:hypothetical protein [Dendronalium phyllosphericum]|nr:hypothetical protein [Dendronalium phyllosphericum]
MKELRSQESEFSIYAQNPKTFPFCLWSGLNDKSLTGHDMTPNF